MRALVAHQPDVGPEQEGGFEIGTVGIEFSEVRQDAIGFARVALLKMRCGRQHQRIVGQVAGRVVQPNRLQSQHRLASRVKDRTCAIRNVGNKRQPSHPATRCVSRHTRRWSRGSGRTDLSCCFEVLSVEPVAADFEQPRTGTVDTPRRREVDHQLGVTVLGSRVLLLMKLALGQQEQRVLAEAGSRIDEVRIQCISKTTVLVEFLEKRLAGPLREVEEPGGSLALQVQQQRFRLGMTTTLGQPTRTLVPQSLCQRRTAARIGVTAVVGRRGVLDCRVGTAQWSGEHVETADFNRAATYRTAQQAGREQGRSVTDFGIHCHP